MDDLDNLLDRSAARPFAVDSELERVVNRAASRGFPSRRLLVVGVLALLLGGGTAAVAGGVGYREKVDAQFDGGSDAAWELEVELDGETWSCYGGISVQPARSKSGFVEEDYLLAKRLVQEHDWSGLVPDESLLHPGRTVTAYDLAVSAQRHEIEIMRDAGLSVDSISTAGTAECVKK